MEGGCQENHTNLQEGVSKWGSLPHVLHEGMDSDHSPDLRASATTKVPQHKARNTQLQQQNQAERQTQTDIVITRNKQQTEQIAKSKKNTGSMAKDMGSKASTSHQENTPKSKNKPSKKKREAAKKKQNMQQETEQQKEQEYNEKAQCMTPNKAPPDTGQGTCQVNSIPIIDEYAVNIFEDESDRDNYSLKDPDDDDETSEALIKTFSPRYDHNLEEEIQQVADKQGLSPSGFQHEKFHFKNQDINTVTAGRPNTRLFTSKSSK
ncbi:hypothetical protein R3W88_008022 [Solanum pinnatisectum]|uniref:Uncharacterized protein n=1 Tax=Solanum pinnatisectum TaxID=50273 RepID=A0AAV9M736_9SOLN|nr:hypothetical protein R3W88_008022 [Solanum pinnatisectum]